MPNKNESMVKNQLTKRQQTVLRLVIEEYVKTAAPVSSKLIIEKYKLKVSSATVRNEMANLEEVGYLMHPHTSAGRIPTELGYRYFVERLMEKVDLSSTEQRMISHQFHQARLDLEHWLRLSAAVLAHTSQNASLVTAPKSAHCNLKHLELISIRENVTLLILVLQGGTVKQQILTLATPADQNELSPLAQQLTQLWSGLDAPGVAASSATMNSSIAVSVADAVLATMRRIDERRSSDIYRDGLLNILHHPEFKQSDGVQQIVRAIEERRIVDQLVAEALQHGGVHIIIGGEGKWEEFSEVGIVLARYGIDDKVIGAMGILGPVRMTYGRAVSIVRYMSRLMSDFMSNLYGNANVSDH